MKKDLKTLSFSLIVAACFLVSLASTINAFMLNKEVDSLKQELGINQDSKRENSTVELRKTTDENTTKIKEMSIHELYSYGDEGEYTPDNLLFSNNLISRIGNNEANICLSINNNKAINLCSKNNLYTIKPTIIIKKSPYITIKKNLFNGSIILFYINNDLTKELKLIIDYINSKGLKIVGLSELLSEDID